MSSPFHHSESSFVSQYTPKSPMPLTPLSRYASTSQSPTGVPQRPVTTLGLSSLSSNLDDATQDNRHALSATAPGTGLQHRKSTSHMNPRMQSNFSSTAPANLGGSYPDSSAESLMESFSQHFYTGRVGNESPGTRGGRGAPLGSPLVSAEPSLASLTKMSETRRKTM